jgi:hypothetical protein
MDQAYQSQLANMDAAFSSLYSNWKYNSAKQATQWANAQQAKVTKFRDDMLQDDTDERDDDERKQTGFEELGETPLFKAGGDWLGTKLGLTPEQVSAGGRRVGQFFADKGLNPRDLLDEGRQRLSDSVEQNLRDLKRRLPRNFDELKRRLKGEEIGEEGTGEGTEMEELGGFGRGAGGVEFRQPQDYGIGEPVGEEPESFEGMSVTRSGSAADDAAVQRDIDARNAARSQEAADEGTYAQRSGAYDDAPPRSMDSFDLDQAADEVEPPRGAVDGGFDSRTVQPAEEEPLPMGRGFDETIRQGEQTYAGDVVENQAARASAEQAADTAESAATAAEAGVGEAAGEAAGEETAGGILDMLGIDDAFNPLGWAALAAGAGLGIYSAVEGADAADAAKAKATAAAAAAARAAAAVPAPLAPLNFTGRYIAPVRSALAGL